MSGVLPETSSEKESFIEKEIKKLQKAFNEINGVIEKQSSEGNEEHKTIEDIVELISNESATSQADKDEKSKKVTLGCLLVCKKQIDEKKKKLEKDQEKFTSIPCSESNDGNTGCVESSGEKVKLLESNKEFLYFKQTYTPATIGEFPWMKININFNDILPDDKKVNIIEESRNSIKDLKKNKSFQNVISELETTNDIPNLKQYINDLKNQSLTKKSFRKLENCIVEIENSPMELPNSDELFKKTVQPLVGCPLMEIKISVLEAELHKLEGSLRVKKIFGKLNDDTLKKIVEDLDLEEANITNLKDLKEILKSKGYIGNGNNETFKKILKDLPNDWKDQLILSKINLRLNKCIEEIVSSPVELPKSYEIFKDIIRILMDIKKSEGDSKKAKIEELKVNITNLEESLKDKEIGNGNNETFKEILKDLPNDWKDQLILSNIITELNKCIKQIVSSPVELPMSYEICRDTIKELEGDSKKAKIEELKANITNLEESLKVRDKIKSLEKIIGWLGKSSIKPTEIVKKVEDYIRKLINKEDFEIDKSLESTIESIATCESYLNEDRSRINNELSNEIIGCIRTIEEKELPMSMWILVNDTIRIITHIGRFKKENSSDKLLVNINKLRDCIELEETGNSNIGIKGPFKPFLGREKSIEVFNKYKKDFFNAGVEEQSNLLAAIGIPGAGKTTFIKNMSAEVSKEFISVVVTYSDPVKLSNDKDEQIEQFTTQLLSSNGISKETAQSPPPLKEIIEQLFDLKECKGLIIFVDDLIPHDGQKGNVRSLISELMTIQNNSRKKENPNKPVMFVFTGLDSNYLKTDRSIFCIPLCNLSPENSILAIADEKMKVIRESKSLWQSFLSCGGNPGLLSLLDTNDSESVFSYKIKESYSRVKLNIINNFLNYKNVCRWFTGSVSGDDLKLWKAWKEKGLIQDADGLQYLAPQLLRLWANDDNNDDINGNNNLIKLLKNHLRDAYEGDVLCVPGQEKNMETVTMNFECIRKILVGNGKEVTVKEFFAGAMFKSIEEGSTSDESFKTKKLKINILETETSLVKNVKNLGKSEDEGLAKATATSNTQYNEDHDETILEYLEDGYTVASEKQTEKGVERIVPFYCGDDLLVALMQDKFMPSPKKWKDVKKRILKSECVEFLRRNGIRYFVVFNTTFYEHEDISSWEEGIGYKPIGCVYFTGTELIENTFRFGPLKLNCAKLEATVNENINYSSAKTKYPHLHKDYKGQGNPL